jgi:hypothetical protein
MLFIGWGNPVRGMETRALEAFNDAMGLLGRMQQEGRIESFEVAIMSPNSDIDGFVAIKGTAEQLAAVREDQEFQRNTAQAQLCVERIRHIDGYTNEGVAQQMALYQEAIEQVPQRA